MFGARTGQATHSRRGPAVLDDVEVDALFGVADGSPPKESGSSGSRTGSARWPSWVTW